MVVGKCGSWQSDTRSGRDRNRQRLFYRPPLPFQLTVFHYAVNAHSALAHCRDETLCPLVNAAVGRVIQEADEIEIVELRERAKSSLLNFATVEYRRLSTATRGGNLNQIVTAIKS